MTESLKHPARVIPLVDQRIAGLTAPALPSLRVAANGLLGDARGRPLRDLRISVTDRCNFRCNYCMPKEVFDKNYAYLPHSSLLSFEEITRIARRFVAHGVQKIRLTGGEPLLRKNIEVLVEQLAALRTVDGKPLDLTLTTNGSLLRRKAQSLKSAGLNRVTVSLDGLDDAVFRRMNDVDFPVADVLEGLEAARSAGLGRDANGGLSGLKVNMVVKRGTNDQEILPMARHFKGTGITLRFIEFMDVGATNGWRMDEVLPSREVVQRIHARMPLVQLDPSAPGETAERWGYANASGQHDVQAGEVGMISSVTQAFCGDCNRARLSTEGKLYLCLFASQGHDLRALMRSGATDDDLESAIGHIWHQRDDRYSELRSLAAPDVSTRRTPRRDELHRRMTAISDITAMVLAGGRGSRMGGVDKGLQNFNGTPLALHTLLRLNLQAGGPLGGTMLNANRNLAAYEAFGAPVWPDVVGDFAGPLAGFLTGLERCETPLLLTVPCDTPLFPFDLADRLLAAMTRHGADVAMAAAPEPGPDGAPATRMQPVFCLMKIELMESLAAFVGKGGRKIDAWTATLNSVAVPFDLPGDDPRAFFNANTLAELQSLQDSAAR